MSYCAGDLPTMNAYDFLQPQQKKLVDDLLSQMQSHDGLAPVDLDRFWADQEPAMRDPFAADIPQVPLGAFCTWECVFAELGIEEDYRCFETDDAYRVDVSRRYNDLAERIVGRRLLDEKPRDPDLQYPACGGLHTVFEARNEWLGGPAGSWWMHQAADTRDELKALLDRVEQRDIRATILPPDWEQAKARLLPRGIKPPIYRHQRGPVTFATSIFGPENLIYLILDEPDLAARLSDQIKRVILEIARIRDEEAGYSPQDAPRGWSFHDDNCALLNAEMYEFFALPITTAVYGRYCPDSGDWRYHHSDSAMAHQLPNLAKAGVTVVNLGPTLTVREIRQQLPRAAIHGQLAPFTYSRNEQANMVAEFLRDFEQAQAQRGLVFATSGSVNNGSRLAGMRLLMAAIQRYGRYQ
ncbi:MAG: hypothetical protein IT445_02645 [Phycisphaeraceae bacterium]|nr:hypothetical protein [Phycisphaeraceae bacterium]